MVNINKAYWGNQNVKHIYFGRDHVKRIYKGSELIYLYGWNPVTFNASSSIQTFTVPLGTNKIHVDCVASRGALKSGDYGDKRPGYGGRVQCDLKVTPGQKLYIVVGAIPSDWTTASYNASDIRTNNAGVTNTTSLNSRLVVAGGGGSARSTSHDHYAGNGGNGGGTTGASGLSDSTGRARGGTGGTQSAGGNGGTGINRAGGNGSLGLGGNNASSAGAGAGGAGYYGGGAGGYGATSGQACHAGGGGGSSYAKSSVCTNVVHTRGYRNGAGYITISFVE